MNTQPKRKTAKDLAKVANATATGTPAKTPLLAGGNPQVTKADGDAPARAYIAALLGWKCAIGSRLDALIDRAVQNVHKVVRWNSRVQERRHMLP